MEIKYEQTGKFIEISFDKVLKDLFKQNFKTAIWDRWGICWKIKDNTRNLNKLKKWIETVENSNVLEELKKVDELEFTKAEIEKLEQDLRTWKMRIRAVREGLEKTIDQNHSKKELIEKLEAAKSELKKYEDLHTKEQTEKEDLSDKLHDILEKYIDIDLVLDAQQTMSRLRNKANRSFLYAKEKGEYNSAQAKIVIEHKKLRDAGWISTGLSALCIMNCNRPDRDNPAFVTEDNIYNLIERED